MVNVPNLFYLMHKTETSHHIHFEKGDQCILLTQSLCVTCSYPCILSPLLTNPISLDNLWMKNMVTFCQDTPLPINMYVLCLVDKRVWILSCLEGAMIMIGIYLILAASDPVCMGNKDYNSNIVITASSTEVVILYTPHMVSSIVGLGWSSWVVWLCGRTPFIPPARKTSY